MAEPILSEPAIRDIALIRNSVLRTNGKPVADRILRGLLSTIGRLELFPQSGRQDARLWDESIRLLFYQRWVVVYEERSDSVVVLRVVDAARDIAAVELTGD